MAAVEDHADDEAVDDRVSTGIPGLDAILLGGFLRNGFYLLQGDPGAGKTTLALQYLRACHQRAEPGLYITLTESRRDLERTCRAHGWDVTTFTICDLTRSRVNLNPLQPDSVFYPSEIELSATTQQIIAEVERRQPLHVVFDGLSELRLLSSDPLRYRHQMLALKHFFEDRRVTVLLLDDRTNPAGEIHPESLVGGNLIMERYLPGYGGARRRLQVTKVRSAAFRDGYHDYEIQAGGVVVYPRLTLDLQATPPLAPTSRAAFSSGIANLDTMLGSGLETGTTTLLVGPSGMGKSTVAMKYVTAALQRGEKAAIYAFDEVLNTLFERSERLCAQGIWQHAASGLLHAQQVNPAELTPGSFSQEVCRTVEAGARIVVIDSLNGYLNAMPEERFLPVHLHELFTYLNQRGVVTLAVVAQHGLLRMDETQIDMSYLADAVLLFRNFEAQGQILKALSVYKKRTGSHEQSIRQLSISAEGIVIGAPLTAFHGIMTGVPEYRGDTRLSFTPDETAP
jgi:circadian clock protein KaiC